MLFNFDITATVSLTRLLRLGDVQQLAQCAPHVFEFDGHIKMGPRICKLDSGPVFGQLGGQHQNRWNLCGGIHRRKPHEGLDAPIEGLGDAIEAEVEQAINLGAKALRNAFKSSFQEDTWGDALFAKAEAPRGEDFVCKDNQIIVSQLRDVRLQDAEFQRNTLNAAGISDCEVSAGRFAAGRRVQVPWGYGFASLTPEGQDLMQRAIDWAAGRDQP